MKKTLLIEISPDQLDEKLNRIAQLILSNQPDTTKIINGEVYYTRRQVADLFQVQLSTIHNWVTKGVLKSYGLGNRVYFKKSEIELALIPLNS